MLPLLALRAFSPARALQIFTRSRGGRYDPAQPSPLSRDRPPLTYVELRRLLADLPGPPWEPAVWIGWRSALGFVDIHWDPLAATYFEAMRESRALRIAEVRYEAPRLRAERPRRISLRLGPLGRLVATSR